MDMAFSFALPLLSLASLGQALHVGELELFQLGWHPVPDPVPDYELELLQMGFGGQQVQHPPRPVSPRLETGHEALGDPHMMNMFGQRFDLAAPGKHTLVHLPKDAPDKDAFFKMTCEVKLMSASCADMYIQVVNMTGGWLQETGDGAMTFDAQRGQIWKGWMHIGPIVVKVARGVTGSHIKYLSVFTKHLASSGLQVGGLLGEDDHARVSVPPKHCIRNMSF